MDYPIADLHCDLLCYLERDKKRTAYDSRVRCALPQLRAGNVVAQTMAVFTATERGSVTKGKAQLEIFQRLPREYPDGFCLVPAGCQINEKPPSQRINIFLGIENASALFEEEEPLEGGMRFLQNLENEGVKPIYISLTWNMENRFGGGASTKVGLKEDGKQLLHFLDESGIAIDVSHASDSLARDILNYADRHSLCLSIIASHSNLRAVADVPRNLPDDIAEAIILRKGVIGLNVIRAFVGIEQDFARHLEKLLALGGEDHVCLGADFFYEGDVSLNQLRGHILSADELFFPDFGDASTYPRLLHLYQKRLGVSHPTLEKIAYKNLYAFLTHLWKTLQQTT